MAKGRAVLWGAGRHDWQIGGPYDRQRTRLADDLCILRRKILNLVMP